MTNYFESQNITLAGVVIYGAVALFVYFATPKVFKLFSKKALGNNRVLVLASAIFFISLFLPSPLIHGRNTNFTTHFVGGGLFTGILWFYLKSNLKIKLSWFVELSSLYFLVCGLGVANELFEFLANGIGVLNIPGTDTWWDLFANTLGVLTFWILYRLFYVSRR